MRVKIRLLGVLRDAGGSKEMVIDAPSDSTVSSIIQQMIDDDASLRTALWDESVDSPIPNALIMLDGIEVNNLKGIETPVNPNQELVLLSVVHGG